MSMIKNRLDAHVDKTENLVKYLLKKRKHTELLGSTLASRSRKKPFSGGRTAS